MELSEARQHEAQKLVLENFEDHARTISCAVHVEEDGNALSSSCNSVFLDNLQYHFDGYIH